MFIAGNIPGAGRDQSLLLVTVLSDLENLRMQSDSKASMSRLRICMTVNYRKQEKLRKHGSAAARQTAMIKYPILPEMAGISTSTIPIHWRFARNGFVTCFWGAQLRSERNDSPNSDGAQKRRPSIRTRQSEVAGTGSGVVDRQPLVESFLNH